MKLGISMSFLSLLATTWGIAMSCGNFFQAYRIFKLKEAKDISVVTWSIIFIGTFIWAAYGFEIMNLPIIIPNIIGIFASGAVLYGWCLYRNN